MINSMFSTRSCNFGVRKCLTMIKLIKLLLEILCIDLKFVSNMLCSIYTIDFSWPKIKLIV